MHCVASSVVLEGPRHNPPPGRSVTPRTVGGHTPFDKTDYVVTMHPLLAAVGQYPAEFCFETDTMQPVGLFLTLSYGGPNPNRSPYGSKGHWGFGHHQ